MKDKIVGYGELLLRLTPTEHAQLIEQSDSLQMGFAGAEANVLADLAHLGHDSQFISALPRNPIGRKAEQFLKQHGVNSTKISWTDHARLGTYFIEHGHSIRGTVVTYDRKDSAVCHQLIDEDEWNRIFIDAAYFILSGVTSALSSTCHQNVLTGLACAQEHGVKIVFDLNYRRSLWSAEDARLAYIDILPFVNILIGNVGSANDVFEIPIKKWDDYNALCAATLSSAHALQELGDFDSVAMTMRIQQSASHHELGGLLLHDKTVEYSPVIPLDIIDRIGGGDAFAAGLIHGMIHNWDQSKMVRFATSCYAATHTLNGDINILSESDLLDIANGELKGFTKR